MNGLKGLDADDMRTVGQQARQGILMGGIAGDKTHKKVTTTPDHVTLARFGPCAYLRLKRLKDTPLLALKADQGIKIQRPAKQRGIHLGMIAFDDSKFLKPPDTSQTGRCGNAGATGQFHIGHASISLEFGDDLPVNGIQFDRCGVRRSVHFNLTYMAADMIRKDGTCVGSLYMRGPDTH